jgi:hypothetical protein
MFIAAKHLPAVVQGHELQLCSTTLGSSGNWQRPHEFQQGMLDHVMDDVALFRARPEDEDDGVPRALPHFGMPRYGQGVDPTLLQTPPGLHEDSRSEIWVFLERVVVVVDEQVVPQGVGAAMAGEVILVGVTGKARRDPSGAQDLQASVVEPLLLRLGHLHGEQPVCPRQFRQSGTVDGDPRLFDSIQQDEERRRVTKDGGVVQSVGRVQGGKVSYQGFQEIGSPVLSGPTPSPP